KLRDRRAAGRDQGGLDVLLIVGATLVPYSVEDLADHMKRRHEIRAAVADEQPHVLAYLGGQNMVTDEGILAAVEDDIRRLLIDRLLHVERLQPLLPILTHGVEVSLHHV